MGFPSKTELDGINDRADDDIEDTEDDGESQFDVVSESDVVVELSGLLVPLGYLLGRTSCPETEAEEITFFVKFSNQVPNSRHFGCEMMTELLLRAIMEM